VPDPQIDLTKLFTRQLIVEKEFGKEISWNNNGESGTPNKKKGEKRGKNDIKRGSIGI